ncbi:MULTISPECIES: 50S ribosomal protein L32 [Glycomyces]|uniref:Large ribosomal subunit protein bL32 n=3 Tax=Glycomyces TaxID=58113 RepID=A0A2T0UIM1_9ACTN|nr:MULTISPECIES: 50S ribosomal protein L32 [Glycomyces]NUQ90418.1 50S ribosomal protein L32 [Glycomyces artemisiae]PRY57716.1 LSU ribosomal protein L32P [Glycomyces artemisiae]BFF27448.1 50S ribosomal protein L32 [Glycomyces mayteni]SDL49457.1 large subunit ribosomal protein L32 [Glycomyces sambucus]
MAVPKRRMSRSNTRHRRSQWKATPIQLVECPQCHAKKRGHQVCEVCGTYKGRQVLEA